MNKIIEYLFATLGIFAGICFLLIGLAQLGFGLVGIEHHLGWWAVMGAAVALFPFRIMLPITIGAYFGVVDVFGWPWWLGVLIAAPGVFFMFPAFVALLMQGVYKRIWNRE